MKLQLVTIALVSFMPWSSSAVPAQTERRGCRAGYSLNVTNDLCELCPSGTFTDTYNWENRCQPCTPCSEGRQLVTECNASSNTVCRCADDHYEHEDGCSPKTGTTRSGIEELNPILQSIKKQIGTEAQKSQDKLDNLSKAVDLLRKDVVSGEYAEEAFQTINDKMQTNWKLLVVVVVVVVLLFFVVLAMLVAQHYSKPVDLCQRCRGRGLKDQKGKNRDQPPQNPTRHDPHASPHLGDRGSSSQQKEKLTVPREHTGSVVCDGTPRLQSNGARAGADVDLQKLGENGALAVADCEESPTTSTVKTDAPRVGVKGKERSRNRAEEGTGSHREPGVTTSLIQNAEESF